MVGYIIIGYSLLGVLCLSAYVSTTSVFNTLCLLLQVTVWTFVCLFSVLFGTRAGILMLQKGGATLHLHNYNYVDEEY